VESSTQNENQVVARRNIPWWCGLCADSKWKTDSVPYADALQVVLKKNQSWDLSAGERTESVTEVQTDSLEHPSIFKARQGKRRATHSKDAGYKRYRRTTSLS
jgi:hypothetical protein